MADETTKEELIFELKIDRGASEKEIDDLTESIEETRSETEKLIEANKALKKSGQDNTKAFQENAKTIEINKDAIARNNSARKNVINAIKAEDNSLGALKARLAEDKRLRDQVNLSTDTGRKKFDDLTKSIKANNEALLKAEKASGNFTRNVGNYASALDQVVPGTANLVGTVTNLGTSFGDTVGAIAKTGFSLQTLNTIPVVALLIAIVGALQLLKTAFDEVGKETLKQFNYFQDLSGAFVQLTKDTQNYTDFLKATNDLLNVKNDNQLAVLENERSINLLETATQKTKVEGLKEEIKTLAERQTFLDNLDKHTQADLARQLSLTKLIEESGLSETEYLKKKKEELETEQRILLALKNQSSVLSARIVGQRDDDDKKSIEEAEKKRKEAEDKRIAALKSANDAIIEENRRMTEVVDFNEVDTAKAREAREKEAFDKRIEQLNEEMRLKIAASRAVSDEEAARLQQSFVDFKKQTDNELKIEKFKSATIGLLSRNLFTERKGYQILLNTVFKKTAIEETLTNTYAAATAAYKSAASIPYVGVVLAPIAAAAALRAYLK